MKALRNRPETNIFAFPRGGGKKELKEGKDGLKMIFVRQFQHWEEETSRVPAEASRQCDRSVWCDRVGGFVNNDSQGPGLCFADSSGDVSIVQETYREESTWLLVC